MSYRFPKIETLDDLLFHIKDCNYLVASKKENGTTTVCYIYSDKDSFANEWERECRGITFDRDGKIISRTMHKFFNLNEKPDYQVENIDFTKVKAIFPKLDGSMISTYVLDDVVVAKSKNSFLSDVAVKAQTFIDKNVEYLRFCKDMFESGKTPSFEYTAPTNRIVVDYKEEGLTLIQVRDNVSGEYYDIHDISKDYDIAVLDYAYDKTKDISELVHEMESMTGIEGFIVLFEDGDMVKIKTPWYIGLHHSVTFVRYRDIAKLVCTQKLDDFRALVVTGKYDGIDLNEVDKVEKVIFDKIERMESVVNAKFLEMKDLYETDGVIDFKSVSIALKQDSDVSKESFLFNFVFNKLRGKENDYMEYYQRNLLKKEWNLDQIP